MYIIIGGGGKVGEVLARQLLDLGHEVVTIELKQSVADAMAGKLRGRFMVVQGDCCDTTTMEEAGIRDADAFIAVCGHDDVNLVACEIVRALYHPGRIIARINNPRNERIFSKMGIEAISSTTVVARMIAEEALGAQMRTVISLRNGEMSLFEMEIPSSASLRDSGGVRVRDVELPDQALIVASAHGEDYGVVTPSTLLAPGDMVLVCAKASKEPAVRQALLEL